MQFARRVVGVQRINATAEIGKAVGITTVGDEIRIFDADGGGNRELAPIKENREVRVDVIIEMLDAARIAVNGIAR